MNKKNFLSYEAAASWARSVGIKSSTEWARMLTAPSIRPQNIPANPNVVYPDFLARGGWGGFLDTGVVACSLREYRSYEEAKKWASSQMFTGQTQWLKARRETPQIFPSDIPACPNTVYPDFLDRGGWGSFLGTGLWSNKRKKQERASFEEAMSWGRDHGILTAQEWAAARRPQNIPSSPDVVYPEEFAKIGGWAGFLRGARGNNTSAIELAMHGVLSDIFCSNPEDRGRIHLNSIGGKKKSLRVDWVDRATRLIVEYDGLFFHKNKRVEDNKKTMLLLSLSPAWNVVRVRSRGLEPIDAGHDIQVKGGNASIASEVVSIIVGLVSLVEDGKIVVPGNILDRAKKFITDDEHRRGLLSRVMRSIPISSRYADFDKASEILANFSIPTVRDFEKRCREDPDFPPPGVPRAPLFVYPDFYNRGGWSAFLGTKNRPSRGRVWRSYDDAVAWVRSQKIKSHKEWVKKCQEPGWLPIDIPSNPRQIYKNEFCQNGGVGAWLGTGSISNKNKKLASFEEASEWARTAGIKSASQWLASKDIRPPNIPSSPPVHYSDFFERGGWAAILGKDTQPTLSLRTPRRRKMK